MHIAIIHYIDFMPEPHHSPPTQTPGRTSGILPTYMRLLQLAWKQYIVRFDVILWANVLIATPLYFLVDWSMPRALLENSDILQSTSLVDWFARADALTAIVMQPEFLSHLAIQFVVKLCLVYIVCVIVIMLKHHFYQQPWTREQLFEEALAVFPRAIFAAIITQVMIGVGYFIFVIPGLILEIVLSLAVPMLIWYDLSPVRAIVRSLQVGFRNWWFVFSYIILTQLLVEATSAIVIAAMPDQLGFVTIGLTITNIFASFTTIFLVLLITVMDTTLVRPKSSAKSSPESKPTSKETTKSTPPPQSSSK